MLEYLFFSETLAARFTERLSALGLAFTQSVEPIERAIVITVDEDAAEPFWDGLDQYYDDLADEDQSLLEQSEGGLSVSGIYIALKDGQRTVARVSPELLNRILSVVSMSELNEFVEAIAHAVEQPDELPLCKK